MLPLLFGAAIAGVPSAASGPEQAGPTSAASVFISPTGSDTALCTKTSPCASLNRAYIAARPGATVDVAPGTYPGQTLLWRPGRDQAPQVVFRPRGKVTIEGNLFVFASGVWIAGRATGSVTNWRSRTYSVVVTGDMAVLGNSAAQHPRNVTLEGIDGGSLGTYTSQNVVVRDMDVGPVVLSACNRAESKIGPNVDAELFTPRNITWERVVVHGMDRDASAAQAGCHYGGLFVVSARDVTIRESVFTENIVYNIQVQNYVGEPTTDVLIQNTWFGCPVLAVSEAPAKTCNGQASIQFNAASTFSDWLIRYNSFAASDSVNADGGRASFSNVRFVGNAGQRPGNDVCGRTGTAFSSNAWVGSTCGPSDKSIPNPFVSIRPGQEDLHLRARTGAANMVAGADADHAIAADIERRMRPLRVGRDAGSVQRETAEIVPWRSIGFARLGMTRDEVRAFHGRPRSSTVRRGVRTDFFRVYRGRLWVTYRDERTEAIGTTSPYYTTRSGVGVGSPATGFRSRLPGRWHSCGPTLYQVRGRTVAHVAFDRTGKAIASLTTRTRSGEKPCPDD